MSDPAIFRKEPTATPIWSAFNSKPSAPPHSGTNPLAGSRKAPIVNLPAMPAVSASGPSLMDAVTPPAESVASVTPIVMLADTLIFLAAVSYVTPNPPTAKLGETSVSGPSL